MTEQEAEALAARLIRVWRPEEHATPSRWTLEEGFFDFGAELPDEMFISIDNEWDDDILSVSLSMTRTISEVYLPTGSTVYLARRPNGEMVVGPPISAKEAEEFAAQWMPFFRRGCWLCGLPIEASAHEKAEWMRGFKREELESWNLEF